MNCKFKRNGNKVTCERCGFTLQTNNDEKKIFVECPTKPKKEYPSTLQMGINLVSSLVDYTMSGFRGVTEEEKERRLNICKSCPLYDLEQSRCTKCGCWMDWKANMESAYCPEHKW